MKRRRQLVHDRLSTACNDLGTARTFSIASRPFLDTAIYHCQQTAEKALKAFLVFHDRRLRKRMTCASCSDWADLLNQVCQRSKKLLGS
jgi:HEPN domain-containing protein